MYNNMITILFHLFCDRRFRKEKEIINNEKTLFE